MSTLINEAGRDFLPLCTAVVKNKTKTHIQNIELVWMKKPDIPIKLKKIKKGDFKRECLPSSANGKAPLKMYYTDPSNTKHEYTILEELVGMQGRLICISITEIDESGDLKFDVDPCYQPPF